MCVAFCYFAFSTDCHSQSTPLHLCLSSSSLSLSLSSLKHFPTEGRFFKHRMFRESCLAVEGNYLKDLTVLGRDMSKMVHVDNSPHAFGYQVDNGIPIESWFDDQNDKELLKLERYLQVLHKTNDVRDSVRETFQTYRKVAES